MSTTSFTVILQLSFPVDWIYKKCGDDWHKKRMNSDLHVETFVLPLIGYALVFSVACESGLNCNWTCQMCFLLLVKHPCKYLCHAWRKRWDFSHFCELWLCEYSLIVDLLQYQIIAIYGYSWSTCTVSCVRISTSTSDSAQTALWNSAVRPSRGLK